MSRKLDLWLLMAFFIQKEVKRTGYGLTVGSGEHGPKKKLRKF